MSSMGSVFIYYLDRVYLQFPFLGNYMYPSQVIILLVAPLHSVVAKTSPISR